MRTAERAFRARSGAAGEASAAADDAPGENATFGLAASGVAGGPLGFRIVAVAMAVPGEAAMVPASACRLPIYDQAVSEPIIRLRIRRLTPRSLGSGRCCCFKCLATHPQTPSKPAGRIVLRVCEPIREFAERFGV